MATESIAQSKVENNLERLATLKWLADRGARFCKVTPWNDPGDSPGKKPMGEAWQKKPYTFEDLLPHIKAGGNVGLICGSSSGSIGLLDVDENFTEFKQSFPDLATVPAIIRADAADKGKILFKVVGSMPAARKWKHSGEKHPFLEWLSDGNQGVIPPSRHPAGSFYELINKDREIYEITPEALDFICATWAGGGLLNNEPQAPGKYPQPETTPSNGGGLKEAVKARWDSLSVFEYFGKAGDTRKENRGTELRLKGNGGLFIQVATGLWAIPGDGPKAGGDCISAWWWCETGNHNTPKGKEFNDLLVRMAQAGGLSIPEHQSANNPDYYSLPEPEKPTKYVPDDGDLAARWLARAGLTAYGLGEWRRYEAGAWPAIDVDMINQEIKTIVQAAKTEGVRLTAARVASVKELARIEIAKGADLWDANPDFVICKNGALHIPSMQLRPHNPDYLATFKVNYDYDLEAEAPIWIYALNSTIPDAAEFLQEFVGYSLTMDTRHELALWFCGPRGSGKSTIIEGIQAMLGDRATLLGLAEVERSRFALGDLRGKTLAVASEQPALYMQSTYILNRIISGEPIRTERKFEDPITFTPRVKLIWAMTEMPRVPDAGDGLFRRVKVIKFPPLSEEERDPAIKEAIKTEGAGILNWALAGLARLRARNHFIVPPCVKDATDDFQLTNDIPALFVQECCSLGADLKTQAQTLYNAYKSWCEGSGHKPQSSTSLAREWERLGFTRYKAAGRAYWQGIEITPIEGASVAGVATYPI